MTALAAVLAALAVWLLLPHQVRPCGRPGPAALGPTAVVAVAAGALVVVLQGTVLALALILLGAAGGAWQLHRRARHRRAAIARSERVVEVCEWLAGDLRAGQPPQTALRRAVEAWPDLEPVAAAAELGADVPAALRRLAALPGASGLTAVAAAWQVSQASGGTMALALGHVADGARRRRSMQQLVTSELASAQATARLVALLPVLVLALGSGLGGDPWRFLLSTPAGLVCLATGATLALTGLGWIERIAARAVEV